MKRYYQMICFSRFKSLFRTYEVKILDLSFRICFPCTWNRSTRQIRYPRYPLLMYVSDKQVPPTYFPTFKRYLFLSNTIRFADYNLPSECCITQRISECIVHGQEIPERCQFTYVLIYIMVI